MRKAVRKAERKVVRKAERKAVRKAERKAVRKAERKVERKFELIIWSRLALSLKRSIVTRWLAERHKTSHRSLAEASGMAIADGSTKRKDL